MGRHEGTSPPGRLRRTAAGLYAAYRRVRKALAGFLASGALVAGLQVLNGIDWSRPAAYAQPLAVAICTAATVYATRNGSKADQTAG